MITSIGTKSIQLVQRSGADANAAAANSLYNFDSLLQYVVSVYGTTPSVDDPEPPFALLATSNGVTIYNAHVDGAGNSVPLNPNCPTFVLVPGRNGYTADLGNLARAIASASQGSPDGHVNVLLATWRTSRISGANDSLPWDAASLVNQAGYALGGILANLVNGGSLSLAGTTLIMEDLGVDVGNAAAHDGGGIANAIALNLAASFGSYTAPTLHENFQHAIAYQTSSLLDYQGTMADSNQTLPTNPGSDFVAQHTAGVSWLTQPIVAGNASLLNANSAPGPDLLPSGNNPVPPAAPAGLEVDAATVFQVAPIDPNNIIGPKGAGTNQYVRSTQPLPYEITFTNVPTANAPAQEVVVTQKLDSSLDWRDFRLGDFGFGGEVFHVPDNSAYYQTLLDLSQQRGFDVEVTATIDERAGVSKWIFTTIDPTTGQIPIDPMIGFLPADNASGSGEGFVTYTVGCRDFLGLWLRHQGASEYAFPP